MQGGNHRFGGIFDHLTQGAQADGRALVRVGFAEFRDIGTCGKALASAAQHHGDDLGVGQRGLQGLHQGQTQPGGQGIDGRMRQHQHHDIAHSVNPDQILPLHHMPPEIGRAAVKVAGPALATLS